MLSLLHYWETAKPGLVSTTPTGQHNTTQHACLPRQRSSIASYTCLCLLTWPCLLRRVLLCFVSIRAVINPSELRIALASHTPFKCQEMNDANELLDTIYECFAQAQVGLNSTDRL